jgi:hypothetical protein
VGERERGNSSEHGAGAGGDENDAEQEHEVIEAGENVFNAEPNILGDRRSNFLELNRVGVSDTRVDYAQRNGAERE